MWSRLAPRTKARLHLQAEPIGVQTYQGKQLWMQNGPALRW